jgi:hypothetical protein
VKLSKQVDGRLQQPKNKLHRPPTAITHKSRNINLDLFKTEHNINYNRYLKGSISNIPKKNVSVDRTQNHVKWDKQPVERNNARTQMVTTDGHSHNEKSMSATEHSFDTGPTIQNNLLRPINPKKSSSILSSVHPELAKVSHMLSKQKKGKQNMTIKESDNSLHEPSKDSMESKPYSNEANSKHEAKPYSNRGGKSSLTNSKSSSMKNIRTAKV